MFFIRKMKWLVMKSKVNIQLRRLIRRMSLDIKGESVVFQREENALDLTKKPFP